MRLVDADELLNYIPSEDILSRLAVQFAPTVELMQKKGKWIKEPNCWYRCSLCGNHQPSIRGYMSYKFCPSCGADMREEQESRMCGYERRAGCADMRGEEDGH